MRMDRIPATTPAATINRLSKLLWGDAMPMHAAKSELGGMDAPGRFEVSVRKVRYAERLLDNALREFYRGLCLLKSFASLNMVAFGKILKKHDKLSMWKALPIYLKAFEDVHFQTSTKVDALIESVEGWYSEYFAGKSHRKAMTVLRPVKSKASHTVTFFLGMCMGGIVALMISFVALLVVAGGYESAGGPSYIESVFPVFSGLLLVVLHLYMYGINLFCWRAARINYPFIFEFSPGTELRYRQVLLIASGLLVLVLGGMVAHIAAHSRTYLQNSASEVIPSVVVMIPALAMILPFNVLYHSSRKFFLATLKHIICAPFYKVALADFFMADQLTSQVPLLRSVQYVTCYYAGAFFLERESHACLQNPHYTRFSYIIALLPYFSRLMQCGRRYMDERDWVQVANGFKYLSAMFAVALRLFHVEHGTSALFVLSIVFSTWATLYGAWWDLVMDWGLLNARSKNPWLRDNLSLSRKWVYFASMVLNTVFRFAWLQSVVQFRFGSLPKNVMDFIFASLEVCRRGQWNFYRLENEHLNNVGKFRAVRAVPLPFVDEDDKE